MDKDNLIISIGRSFGAGGRAIGKILSNELGINCYDKQLMQEAAESFGFSRDIFTHADERKPSIFRRLVSQSYGVSETYMAETLSGETLYHAQSRIIRAIASRESCIIIGRTADYILRDFPNLVSVFLHAPLSFRATKILERNEASSIEEAIEMARHYDKDRESYYNYFTGRRWGMASNYDLCLDSCRLSLEHTADIITRYVKAVCRK